MSEKVFWLALGYTGQVLGLSVAAGAGFLGLCLGVNWLANTLPGWVWLVALSVLLLGVIFVVCHEVAEANVTAEQWEEAKVARERKAAQEAADKAQAKAWTLELSEKNLRAQNFVLKDDLERARSELAKLQAEKAQVPPEKPAESVETL